MKIGHVLLTTDLSKEALRPFEPVLELATSMGAKVTVLHVVQDLPLASFGTPMAPPVTVPDMAAAVEGARKALEEECAAYAKRYALDPQIVTDASPARAIVEYAKKHGVDLIAMSTHGRTGLRHLALGSVAEAVLRRSPIPLLTFHRPEGS
jgi:nucleotide-binding universal stress UspA family protein